MMTQHLGRITLGLTVNMIRYLDIGPAGSTSDNLVKGWVGQRGWVYVAMSQQVRKDWWMIV